MGSEISAAVQRSAASTPFKSSAWLRPKYLLFGFIGLMFAYVLVHDESFLINAADPEWQHIATFKWWLLPHGLAGACALLLGPMQFSDRLRARYTKLHRVVGRLYIAGTFIAAPMGSYVQWLEERIGAHRSFTIETFIQGGLWAGTTAIALGFILKGKVEQHRQWMTRSFGTGPLIFLEVRVIDGLTGLHGELVVWMCTASSLFIADIVLQVQELLRNRQAVAAAAARRARVPAALERSAT